MTTTVTAAVRAGRDSRPGTTATAFAALVLSLGLAGCATPEDPATAEEPTTAQEARDQLDAVVRDTLDEVGLDAGEVTSDDEPVPCSLPDGGEGVALPVSTVDLGPEQYDEAVVEQIADHWTEAGYDVTGSAGRVIARTPGDDQLEVSAIPDGPFWVAGSTRCMAE